MVKTKYKKLQEDGQWCDKVVNYDSIVRINVFKPLSNAFKRLHEILKKKIQKKLMCRVHQIQIHPETLNKPLPEDYTTNTEKVVIEVHSDIAKQLIEINEAYIKSYYYATIKMENL